MAKIKSISPVDKSGIGSNLATEIFDEISRFANYGFNKSHAAAYASIAFQTAYLKTHHPEFYLAAAMNNELSEVDEIAAFASDLKSRGIMLWTPDINMSEDIFRPVPLKSPRNSRGHAISYGLSALRGVGHSAAHDIIRERRRAGPFTSIKNFMERLGPAANAKAMSALAHSGAFDRISPNRAAAAAEIQGLRHSNPGSGQMSMFDLVPDLDTSEAIEEYPRDKKLDLEFDTLGHYLSDHPLSPLRKTLFQQARYFSGTIFDPKKEPPQSASMPAVVCGVEMRQTKKRETMAVIQLSDPDRNYEALAFGDTWFEIKPLIRKKARLEFRHSIQANGPERRFIVEDASMLEEYATSDEITA